MKSIIHGNRYDTATAIEIGTAENTPYRSDLARTVETLYRTPRAGRYFIHGASNAAGAYATHFRGGSRGPGERIVPLTEAEAFEWAQENLDADTVEEAFAALISDA